MEGKTGKIKITDLLVCWNSEGLKLFLFEQEFFFTFHHPYENISKLKASISEEA